MRAAHGIRPERPVQIGLELDSAVRDNFLIPGKGMNDINVEQWRGTLEQGFRSGFATAFRLDAPQPELKLQVLEAELAFAPTAVNGYGVAAAAEAQIRYKVRLVSQDGQVLKRSSGTVASKRSAISSSEVTPVAASAVETMYEKIADDFFSEKEMTSGSQP